MDEVYVLFEKEGVLDLLDQEYEDMEHYLIRATIITDIVKMIEEEYHITEKEALKAFYTSATGGSLADDETGLYGQSVLYIFSLYKQEIEEKFIDKTRVY